MIGVEPEGEDFIAGPDESGNTTGPEDVILNLIAKEKDAAVSRGPFRIELGFGAFRFADVEVVVKATVKEPHEHHVSGENLQHPIRFKRHATGDVGLSEKPHCKGDGQIADILGPEVAGPTEEPFGDGFESHGPLEQGGMLDGIVRAPFAANIVSVFIALLRVWAGCVGGHQWSDCLEQLVATSL